MREEPNDRHADSICPLLATHNMEKVAEKWISWVRAESFKRYSEYFFFFFFFSKKSNCLRADFHQDWWRDSASMITSYP